MNKLFLASVIAAAFSLSALAAGDQGDQQTATSAATSAEMTDGEVRKVDKDASKLTIRHGEIKNLDMPAMTMVFQVKDPALLDKVQVGDKLRFKAEKTGAAFVLTEVEPAQ